MTKLSSNNFKEQDTSNSFKYRRTDQRTLVKQSARIHKDSENGNVIALVGRYFLVEPALTPNSIEQYVLCTSSGTLISENEQSSLIAVGDEVLFIREKKNEDNILKGKITKIFERKNCFSRLAVEKYNSEDVIASNIDKVVILMSALEPQYNKRLIDRLLVTAELNMIQPIICINKMDLISLDEIENDFLVYRNLGIKVIFISALQNTGTDKLLELISDCTALIIGPSGVGKSTLLNSYVGNAVQKVNEIAEKTGKGKHTTSFVKMFSLNETSKLIDSPGIREFGIWGLDSKELHLYFHEFDETDRNCKFSQCTHTHEPGCAVIEAYNNGGIDAERYESYCNIYYSLSI